MNVFLSYFDLKIPFEIKEDSTVQELSEKIKTFTNIDETKQELIFKTKSLNFDKTLKEENIQNNDIITLEIKKEIDELEEQHKKTVEVMRKNFSTGKTKSLQFRLNQLKNLKKMMEENEKDFKEALGKGKKKN